MSRPIPSRFRSAALTDIGRKRVENQDACALFSSHSGSLVAAVADGMGGHSGGSIASQLTIQAIHEVLSAAEDADDAALADAILEANARVWEMALEDDKLQGMGTTCVGMVIHPDGRAWVAHVGDSRAYRLRAGQLEALTQDHSLVGELVRAGEITQEEAETDPRRNEILRSVGVGPEVELEITPVTLHPGDRYLLCSDGLSGPVREAEIASLLGQYDPEEAARYLIARANEHGGPDNVTAIALTYTDPNEATDTHVVPQMGDLDDFAREEAERRRRLQKLGLAAAVVALGLVCSLLFLALGAC